MRLLAACGNCPNHFEGWLSTLREAEKRGWELWFTFENDAAAWLLARWGYGERLLRAEGTWQGDKLTVPDGRKVLDAARPDAMLISPAGHGYPGGAWVKLAHDEGIPAVETPPACHPCVWAHDGGKETTEFLRLLESAGYSREWHEPLCRTEKQRWVGMPIGDQVGHCSEEETKRLLGVGRDYVLVSPPWTKGKERASELSGLLHFLSRKADENGLDVVMSLHPIGRLAAREMACVDVPRSVRLTGVWPGEVWGREVRACPLMAAVEHARFVVHTYFSGHRSLCLAARTPVWLQHVRAAHTPVTEKRFREMYLEMAGDGAEMTENALCYPYRQELLDALHEGDEGRAEFWRALPHWRNFLSWGHWGRTSLKLLLSGELGFLGNEADWWRWCGEARVRPDGRVGERIADLLEEIAS